MIVAAFIFHDKSSFAMRVFFNHNYKETNCFQKSYLRGNKYKYRFFLIYVCTINKITAKYKKGIWLFNVSKIENLALMFRKQFVSVRAGMCFFCILILLEHLCICSDIVLEKESLVLPHLCLGWYICNWKNQIVGVSP